MVLSPDRVLIFDTTLRDGEQAPGCRLSQPEKIRVARALAGLGVDVLEAGMPAASAADAEAVTAIARLIEGPVICALSRCNRDDIALTARSLRDAPRQRIHVYLPTEVVRRASLQRAAAEDAIRMAVEGVRIARGFCDDVEFSAEDASRSDLDFLAGLIEATIDAGATTVNVPDTLGHAVPHEFAELFRYLRKNVRGIDRATLSVHCHDDLGMAVANSLMAVVTGARQVECTLNGIGERAGNCSLEEVVMALKTRETFFHAHTAIDTTRLYPASRLLANLTGTVIPRNKAVVGEQALRREAAVPSHAAAEPAGEYALVRPRDVGLTRSRNFLDRHSDPEAVRARVQDLGFKLDAAAFGQLLSGFAALAARKKAVFDGDLEALALRAEAVAEGPWSLERLTTAATSGELARATVALRHSAGRRVERSASGDGPVEAAFRAIEAATGVSAALRRFELRSLSEGEDAQGEALVAAEHQGRSYRGASVSTDIVEAATRAFLDLINRIESAAPPREANVTTPRRAAMEQERTP